MLIIPLPLRDRLDLSSMLFPYGKKNSISHWESQWDCSKIKISLRSWARTSLRIKNLIKNLIKNQEPHQEPHQKSRTWARPHWNSHWESQWESQWGLARDLDFWWGSWWGSWFSMRFLMRFLILNKILVQDLNEILLRYNFGTISLRFSMRKTKKNSVRDSRIPLGFVETQVWPLFRTTRKSNPRSQIIIVSWNLVNLGLCTQNVQCSPRNSCFCGSDFQLSNLRNTH